MLTRTLLSLVFLSSPVFAGSPRLTRVTPPGGQRGTTATVELVGRYLDQPRDILFYEPGITLEAFEKVDSTLAPNGRTVPVEAGTRIRAKLKIADDCQLGAHGLRLLTADGLTEYHRFFVGPFPTIDEDETSLKRNDQRTTAKAVPLNSTVFGRINESADIDLYQIVAKKGQRLSAELEAARLGVDRGIPDLHLMIQDANGKKLLAADDSALFVQDPVLSIVAPADGTYFIEVRHSMYNGLNDQYRLHIGTFTRPTALYPAGGKAGEELTVTILGDPLGVWSHSIKLPAKVGDLAYSAEQDGVSSPTPNKLRVSPFGNVLEAEPNDTPNTNASATTLPIAFNGVIGKPGDVDTFVFRATKGMQLRFHAIANAFGSPVDPLIWIRNVNGKSNSVLAQASNSRPNQLGVAPSNGLNRDSNDPILEFTVPADGEYILGVEDERGEGGPDAVYRVEATTESNGIYTYIAPESENQNAPQLRQAIVLPAGNRWTSQIAIFSTNRPYNGELELVGVNLPQGVTIAAPKLSPGMTKVPVVFEASPDAKPQAALIDLVVRPVKNGEPSFISGYRQTILMNQYGNNDYYLHTNVEKLALAITEPAPFTVEVEEPKSSLVQNGEMLLNFKVTRRPGFNEAVTVMMDWRPTGINTATPTTIPSNKTEGTYLLGAARNASAGKYSLTLTAMSGSGRAGFNDQNNRTYVATKPFTITIAEPHVEARIPRSSIERGKTTTITCKLNHLQKFDGSAKVTLARLPRGVELVDGVKEITAKDKDVSFTLRATSEALVGNYTGVTLDVTVTDKRPNRATT